MEKKRSKKVLAIFLTLAMVFSLIPLSAFATTVGAHAEVQSIAVETTGGSTADTITAGTGYQVNVTVQSTSTYTISPDVTLYEVREGQADILVGSQTTEELVSDSDAITLRYAWTPSEGGTAALRADITAKVDDVETTLDTYTLADIDIVEPEVEDDTSYSGQTAAGDYTISTAAQLAKLAQAVKDGAPYSDSTFTLTEDISLSSVCGTDIGGGEVSWTPIGISSSSAFDGTFDGDGHTISGLYINAEENYQGLFGYVSGAVQNLAVEGSITSTARYLGGIAGYSKGTILNCLSGVDISADSSTGAYGGGIAGSVSVSSKLQGCAYTGQLEVGPSSQKTFGAIAGSGAIVKYCYSLTSVSPAGTYSGASGTIVTEDDYAKAVWGLNTLDGTQGASGKWTYDESGLHLGSGDIYRVRFLNVSSSGTLSFIQNGDTVKQYPEGAYTVVYVPGGTLRVAPSTGVDGYVIAPSGTAPAASASGADFSIPVSADADYSWGLESDIDVHSSQMDKIIWYTKNPSATSFTLETADDLIGLRMLVAGEVAGYAANAFSGKTFTLANNVSLSDVCGADISGADVSWTPIGTSSIYSFSGTFNGGGNTISGLYIDGSADDQGLFGYVTGTIQNLTVSGAVTGGADVGAVAGKSVGAITNCLSLASVSGASAVGGVVGAGSTLTGCVYYHPAASVGVAGSATTVKGCYYLSDSSITGALGQNVTATDFKTREMAYKIDTASGSHAGLWQMGTEYPVLGSNTVILVSLTQAYAQTGKSVALMGDEEEGISVTGNGDTQSAYLTKGQTISLTVTSDDPVYAPLFTPDGAVTESGGTYSITAAASDVVLTYRFAQSVDTDTNWYDPERAEYTLTTEAQLRGLASLVNDSKTSFAGKIIKLGADITVTGGDWPMIGINNTSPFIGTFDGQDHTVSGFYIKITGTDTNRLNYQGFFGGIGDQSTVKNLKLDGTIADARYFAGILAGYATKYCTITNCTTNGTVSYTSTAITQIGAAGMVGDLDQYGVMTDCVNNANVSVTMNPGTKAGSFTMGGLIAYNDPLGEVTNCVNNGTLTAVFNTTSTTISPLVGGIVGTAYKITSYTKCVNNGAISVRGFASGSAPASIGGVVGSALTDVNPSSAKGYVLDGCKNTAPVTCEAGSGSAYVGGIVGGGNNSSASSSTALFLSVVNCENTGSVSVNCASVPKDIYAGGIVGGTNIALSLVSGCTNKASVTLASPAGPIIGTNNGAGGIIGKAFTVDASGGTITRCVNRGVVSSATAQTGGIAGAMVSGVTVTDCYNLASVSGADVVGGVVGVVGGTLRSVFNYGGAVTTSGTAAGLVAGSGMTASNASVVYALDTTRLTGTAAADTVTKTLTATAFKGFDTLYALNSAGRTVEDRGVWTYTSGADYPEFTGETPALYYTIVTAVNGSGSVVCSKQYLTAGEKYTVTFTPESGYLLKGFTVKDIAGGEYAVLFNGVSNGTYSVTLKAPDGKTYDAALKDNVLTCTMAGHSLTFTGDFAPLETGTATVTIDGNGGWFDNDTTKIVQTLNRPYGTYLTLEDLTQPTEYRLFLGWFSDKEGTTPFNFSAALTGDTTIYAKWDTNSQVVFYQLNGGSWNSGAYTAVTSGEKLAAPSEIPVRNGYKFTGWYSDEKCLMPFDFTNTAITQTITLYAGWISSGQHQVIVDANGGMFSDNTSRRQLTISDGASIGAALNTLGASNGGMLLRGWYSDANGGGKWDLSTILTGDLILYAHWDVSADKPTIYMGTQAAPMEIEDQAQLLALRDNVNAGDAYSGGYFRLAGDIELPSGWVPVGALKPGAANEGTGANINPFSGTFDGGNYTISVPPNGMPLFAYVREATVQNLNIYGVQIAGYGLVNKYTVDYGSDGSYYTGEDGGSYAPGCPDTVTIDNVTLTSGSKTLYSGFIGGFASGANTVIIRNSTIESGVVIGYDKSQNGIGSFGGSFNGTIENCSSGATVYGGSNVGGIVGVKGQSMGPYSVNGCMFSGAVIAAGSFSGGIIGAGYSSSSAPNSPCASIQNCLVTGSVTGGDDVGGIFGGEPAVTQCWANGAGYIRNNCFVGTLTATKENAVSGGIIGYMKSLDRYNIIENNYYLKTAAQKGIGDIGAIDYTTDSYKRAVNPFVADDVCTPVTSEELASGRIAALLNSGADSAGTWTQSAAYPVPGTAATAVHAVSLNITGNGTASLTGLGSGTTVYQKAGGKIKLSATPDQGSGLYAAKAVYGDTTVDITDSREFTMPQQDATVYVIFAAWGEKTVDSISIAAQPAKTSYQIGEGLDITGLAFTVRYNDGTSETLAATASMVSGFSSATAGTKTLTLTYMGSIATFTITVESKDTVPDTNINVTFSLLGDKEHDSDSDGAVHTLKAGNLSTWIKPTTVAVKSGSYVGDVFAKVLDAEGYTYSGLKKNYINSITTPDGKELGEFTNGKNSGWMYTLNGTHPLYGLMQQVVSDGDVIVWHYTDDYTREEGSDKWNSGSSAASATDRTVAPKATVINGKGSVSLNLSDMKNAIGNAKSGGDEIIIAPTVSGTVNSMEVVLKNDALNAITDQTNCPLTIQTPVGIVMIPSSALAYTASQVAGQTLTISIESVAKASLSADQQKLVGGSAVFDISILGGNKKISSFDGKSIIISLPYTLKDGETADGVAVWYLSDGGKLEKVTCTYDKSTGFATFTTTHLSRYLVGYQTAWKNPFTDVNEKDWFYGAVEFASKNSLFNGTTATTFGPNSQMTRAMLVTVLYRLAGSPAVTGTMAEATVTGAGITGGVVTTDQTATNAFNDAKDGQWYTDAVAWANANGIVTGIGNGLFGTNNNVTREQLATILYNYANYKGYEIAIPADAGKEGFADATAVSSWAQIPIKWASSEKLITGRTAATLAPGGSATRAEVATILKRFTEVIAK